jgi:hypothetical protein
MNTPPPPAGAFAAPRAIRSLLCFLSLLVAPSSAAFGAGYGMPDWLVAPADTYPARVVADQAKQTLSIENGLVRREFKLSPAAATVALDDLRDGRSLLRSVRAEAVLTIDDVEYPIGGLTGQPIHNYLIPAWLEQMKADPAAAQCVDVRDGATQERFPWKRRPEWLSVDAPWPPAGVGVTFTYRLPDVNRPAELEHHARLKVDVHHELYDGLPLFAKWVTVRNDADKPVKLNRFVAEQLAVVEPESQVGGAREHFRADLRPLEVFTDYAFGGAMVGDVDAPGVRWGNDPLYATQVNYARVTPCLVECAPAQGPNVAIAPGETFETFRVFELLHDSNDRERRGLALRRSYRALAPWTQENPLLMHVRSADAESVKTAIDQSADVGFEIVIMTFGSGFNIEDESPENLAKYRELAAYGKERGVALGGYSLLASRSINEANDAINPKTGKPGDAIFGNSPCLCSTWGEDYFRKLRNFYDATGCAVLEHDGSYPGDWCAATTHPGHAGEADSQWRQWVVIRDFYERCRAAGIYLNVPDWYYLAGSNKCGMGYRETNWSLPREQQEIIERQNIFDGTWEKTPSMGWMFVPLVEYHGGGPAATIEPLREHLDHYETRLANLLGAGVQACYRGPRLYDAPETRAVVKRWVDFYKAHRAILDSDLIHLRRADGRDWDGWLHVNPALDERALAAIYNPLDEGVTRRIEIPLHYAGLRREAAVSVNGGAPGVVALDDAAKAVVFVTIPPRERVFVLFGESPETLSPKGIPVAE